MLAARDPDPALLADAFPHPRRDQEHTLVEPGLHALLVGSFRQPEPAFEPAEPALPEVHAAFRLLTVLTALSLDAEHPFLEDDLDILRIDARQVHLELQLVTLHGHIDLRGQLATPEHAGRGPKSFP